MCRNRHTCLPSYSFTAFFPRYKRVNALQSCFSRLTILVATKVPCYIALNNDHQAPTHHKSKKKEEKEQKEEKREGAKRSKKAPPASGWRPVNPAIPARFVFLTGKQVFGGFRTGDQAKDGLEVHFTPTNIVTDESS